MKAIYVHGLGSGAATSALSTLGRIMSQYEWHAVEVNENLPESVAIINAAVEELDPHLLMGTSLGGLYVMYADLSRKPWCRRILCNPACHISKDIREKIGFGVKDYFVPRQDGVQQYVLDESVCEAFEAAIRDVKCPQADPDQDCAVFSIHDELIGQDGILANMVVCQEAGYRIVVEGKGGHRLGSASVRKIKEIISKFFKRNNDCRNLAD